MKMKALGGVTSVVCVMVTMVMVIVVLGMVCEGEGFEVDEEYYDVKFSVLVTRHGDRTPTKVFKNSKSKWPEGFGMLTGLGMKQLYDLGGLMRERYVEKHKLLSPKVVLSEIYARSTPKERTLVSAQSFLMGLYPHGTGPTIPMNDTFALPNGFQPIPLYSSMPKLDDILYTHKICDKLINLTMSLRKSERWSLFEEDPENVKLFGLLSEIYGEPLSFKHASTIRALIKAEVTHNRESFFGSKVTEEMLQRIERLAEEVMLLKYGTHEMGQLAGGNLIQEILRLISKNSDTLKSHGIRPPRSHASAKATPKFVYFSAHDGTLLALFSAIQLQRPDLHVPQYGSYVVFELRHSPSKGEHVVMVYDGKAIRFPGCNQIDCPVTQFKSAVEATIPDDWQWALSCALKEESTLTELDFANIPFMIGITVIVLAVVVFFFWSR